MHIKQKGTTFESQHIYLKSWYPFYYDNLIKENS